MTLPSNVSPVLVELGEKILRAFHDESLKFGNYKINNYVIDYINLTGNLKMNLNSKICAIHLVFRRCRHA